MKPRCTIRTGLVTRDMPGGYSKVLSVEESAKTSQNWPFVEWVYFRQSTNRELNFRQAFPPIVERRQNRRQKSPEFRNHLRVGHVRIILSKVMLNDLSRLSDLLNYFDHELSEKFMTCASPRKQFERIF